MTTDNLNKIEYTKRVQNYLDDCCFDIQGISSSQTLSSTAEVQLARILTKIVVGAASVWWSALEFREFLKNRRTTKGF
jgi:hypothetical protein